MLMRFGETTWVLFQRVKRLPRFCTAMNWMGGSYDQIRYVFLAPRVESEQAAPGLVVGMLSTVSAKGARVRLGGNPAGQKRGVGELAKGGPGPLSRGVSSLEAARSSGQAQAAPRRPRR